MLKKSYFIGAIVSAASFSIGAVELLDYQQTARGDIAGVVPVMTHQAPGVYRVDITGANRPYEFTLERTETGLDIILSSTPVDGPAGFVVGIDNGTKQDRKTYMVNVGKAALLPTAGAYHKVGKGETITTIAQKYQHLGGSIYQRVMAMTLLNEAAFDGGDINKLRFGSSIGLPSARQVSSLDRKAARRHFFARAKREKPTDRLVLSGPSSTPKAAQRAKASSQETPKDTKKGADAPVAPADPAIAQQNTRLLAHIDMLEARLAAMELRQNIMNANTLRYEEKLTSLIELIDASEGVLSGADRKNLIAQGQ